MDGDDYKRRNNKGSDFDHAKEYITALCIALTVAATHSGLGKFCLGTERSFRGPNNAGLQPELLRSSKYSWEKIGWKICHCREALRIWKHSSTALNI
jgi:hypothetical protein